MAEHFIQLVSQSGHVFNCPLWKLPQLVAAEVEAKKGHIEQVKAEQAKVEAEKAAAEAAARQAQIDEQQHLAVPFDLTVNPGFEG